MTESETAHGLSQERLQRLKSASDCPIWPSLRRSNAS